MGGKALYLKLEKLMYWKLARILAEAGIIWLDRLSRPSRLNEALRYPARTKHVSQHISTSFFAIQTQEKLDIEVSFHECLKVATPTNYWAMVISGLVGPDQSCNRP